MRAVGAQPSYANYVIIFSPSKSMNGHTAGTIASGLSSYSGGHSSMPGDSAGTIAFDFTSVSASGGCSSSSSSSSSSSFSSIS